MKITLELLKPVTKFTVNEHGNTTDSGLSLRESKLIVEVDNHIYKSDHAIAESTYLRAAEKDILQIRANVIRLLIHEVLSAMEDVLVPAIDTMIAEKLTTLEVN